MIPIWAKNKEGSWELFPTHILETFSDGKHGLKWQQLNTGEWNKLVKWNHLFTYDTKNRRYVLTKELETEPEEMSEKILAILDIF